MAHRVAIRLIYILLISKYILYIKLITGGLPNESSPICAIICPETSWYNIQKNDNCLFNKKTIKTTQ